MGGIGRNSPRARRGAAGAALRRGALALLIALASATAGVAQELEPDESLPGSGIRYPRGYDTDTEGVVEGRVARLEVPERGPVVLLLEVAGRPVTVLVAPSWFWERAEDRPAAGDRVRVVGSKTLGADGELYVVSREIEVVGSGCRCAFRDREGRPLWRGQMRGEPSRRCLPPAAAPDSRP